MKPILKVNFKWSGSDLHGYSVEPELEEQNPKQMMLSALGSCTGITLLSLLQKMRLDTKQMALEVVGEFTDNPPQAESPFTRFAVKVEIESSEKESRYGRFARAVELTHSVHCGVNLMMQKIAPVDIKLLINSKEVEL